MRIDDVTSSMSMGTWTTSATIVWEDKAYPPQRLMFSVEADRLLKREVNADAFLTACFPLAVLHGEARIAVGAVVCPLLVDRLHAVHAWWHRWGGPIHPMPVIEVPRGNAAQDIAPRRGAGFLSGGVDSLHMLLRNRRRFEKDAPGYVREAYFVYGLDIGKRASAPESDRFHGALASLRPLAESIGVQLVACRTNLRHRPRDEGFWLERYYGPALIAVGHAAVQDPTFLYVAASQDIATLVPAGSHPCTDELFSSQRVTVVHDGAHLTRLQKVRELAAWPEALNRLRVCPMNIGEIPNCGHCEKCIRTRLELLAVGVDQTDALGESRVSADIIDEQLDIIDPQGLAHYEIVMPFLEARGFTDLFHALSRKTTAYRRRVAEAMRIVA